MKCISIRQPYANLIIYKTEELGLGMVQKKVENRTWNSNYRGPLLIHASKAGEGKCPSGIEYFGDDMHFGAIIGIAKMIDCVQLSKPEILAGVIERYPEVSHRNKPPQFDGRSHVEGPFCFVLQDAWRFPIAIPRKGSLGLFDVPIEKLMESIGKDRTAEFEKKIQEFR